MIGVFEVLLESRTTDRARLSRNEPSANSETPSTDRACPVPSAAHFSGLLRKRKNMGRALPSRKLRKTIATAWLQLLGVQQTRFPEPRSQTLVNSARFDKTGGYLHSFRSVEHFGSMITGICLSHRDAWRGISPGRLRGRTWRPENGPAFYPAGSQGTPRPPAPSPSALSEGPCWLKVRLCVAQRTYVDTFENFEPRAFPQGFLNHLETPAP